MPVGDLVVDLERIVARFVFQLVLFVLFLEPAFRVAAVRVGLEGQQVLQVHSQTVTGGHANHQRTRPLVRTQADLARHRGTAHRQRHAIGVDHVAAQGVHHAIGILRTEAVEHQRLVESDHVGDQIPRTTGGRLRLFALCRAEQQRQRHQPGAAPAAPNPAPA
ncbi:hypothetical protein D3C81_1608680 [compost metagenome]